MTTDTDSCDSPLKGVYYLVSGVFVFSIHDVIIKWISYKYPVHEIVLLRSIFALIPILLIAHLEGGMHLLRTNRYLGHLIRAALLFGSYTFFYLSLAALPIAEAITLFYSAPIFITILSVISLGEDVKIRNWIAVLVGFIGIIIMLRPSSKAFEPAALLMLLAAFLYAIASILTRRLGETESGASLAFYVTTTYIIFSAIFGVALNIIPATQHPHPSVAFLFREWQIPSPGDLVVFIVIGLIAAAGFYFLSQAYRLAKPSTVTPFEYISVPLSATWGYLFWKDILDIQSVLGMLLIIGSGLCIFGSKSLLPSKYALSLFKTKIRR